MPIYSQCFFSYDKQNVKKNLFIFFQLAIKGFHSSYNATSSQSFIDYIGEHLRSNDRFVFFILIQTRVDYSTG